jgi:urease accessory protein
MTQLDLAFAVRGGGTVIARRHVSYPYNVTAPLRHHGPEAQVIVQSVSGGLFGGEVLRQAVSAGPGARVCLRMPSAAVVHAQGTKNAARQTVTLRAEERAILFYLPRAIILLPGSALVQVIDISLARSATVMIRDGFLTHDPDGAAKGARRLESGVTVRQACGRIVALDRMRVTDGIIDAAGPGVTNRYRAFGTVWLLREMSVSVFQFLQHAVAAYFAADAACYAATTALRHEGGALVRIAALDGGDLDRALDAVSELLAGLIDIKAPVPSVA